MIISNRKYPFGTIITRIHTIAFQCVISTAKEGILKPLSTMIAEGDNINGVATLRLCGKIIYSPALLKSDIHTLHEKIAEMINIDGESGFLLGDALESVFAHLKETGLASETINVASKKEELPSASLAEEWVEKGNYYVNNNEYDKAIDAYSSAIELDPKYADAYCYRGYAYGQLGNHQQAIRDYDKAIELDPKFAYAYSARGLAYGKLGNHQQAIKDFDKAIELDPKNADTYSNRGNAYGDLGNHQQAIKDFDKAIELDPRDLKTYIYCGYTYDKLGNYQQAIRDYDKAIELAPKYADAYRLRGSAYSNLGNRQQALEDWMVAARLGDKHAQDFLKSQDTKTVTKKSNDTIENDHELAEEHVNLGILDGKAGNYHCAIENFTHAIENDPNYAGAYLGRGLAFGKVGDFQRKITDYKTAARLGNKKAQEFLNSQKIEW